MLSARGTALTPYDYASGWHRKLVRDLPLRHVYPASRYDLKSFGQDRLSCSDITLMTQLCLPEHSRSKSDVTSVPQPMWP